MNPTRTLPAGGPPAAAAARRAPGPRGLPTVLRAMRHLRRDFLSFLCEIEARYAGEEMAPVLFGMPGQPMALVVHPAQIRQVLTDHDRFTRTVKYMNAFRTALGTNIITVPDGEWKPLRRRTARYFGKAELELYARCVVAVMERHALPRFTARAAAGERVELFEQMLDIASIAVFMAFLGDDVDEPPASAYLALNRIFCFVRKHVFTFWLPPAWVPTRDNRRLARDQAAVRGYLAARLERDRERPTMFGDIIRAHTREDGTADVARILDETVANLVGGSETTIILMAWAMYYLVQYPEIAERLRDEFHGVLGGRAPGLDDLRRMPLLQQVLSETLRLRSPAYVSSRRARRDAELGGYAIPAGTMVFVSQHITHRHPRLWRDPEVFRPERFAPDSPEAPGARRGETVFFPFGGGDYSCLGMNYAVNEAALMVVMLLQQFRFAAADPQGLAAVGVDARLTLRPDRPIAVRVLPDPLRCNLQTGRS